MLLKVMALVLSFGLFFQQIGFAQLAIELNIADHLAIMGNRLVTEKFRPLHLRYFSYDLNSDNFRILLDKGDFAKGLSPQGTVPEQKLQAEAKTLLNYFLVGVTLPDEAFWVNLRPDSESQIIDPWLEQTDVGKIMLEADLRLKKDTALFTSPQTPEGRQYWDRLYKKAEDLYGYNTATIPTLTRPWIVPGEIIVRETQGSGFRVQGTESQSPSAYIYKAALKVMLEQDYLQGSGDRVQGSGDSQYQFKDERAKALNEYSTQLIRELIIPRLTKEVNSSKRYAPLRQVYYSLILSRWFKNKFAGKQGLSPKGTVPAFTALIDTKNLANLISKDPWSKSEYFNQYKKSFSDGEYNIKEPVYTPTGQVIRSYFSGGIEITGSSPLISNRFTGQDNLSKLPGVLLEGNAVEGIKTVAAASPAASSAIDDEWRKRLDAEALWSERRGRALRGEPDFWNEGLDNYLTPKERETRERRRASERGVSYEEWKRRRGAGSPVETPSSPAAQSQVENARYKFLQTEGLTVVLEKSLTFGQETEFDEEYLEYAGLSLCKDNEGKYYLVLTDESGDKMAISFKVPLGREHDKIVGAARKFIGGAKNNYLTIRHLSNALQRVGILLSAQKDSAIQAPEAQPSSAASPMQNANESEKARYKFLKEIGWEVMVADGGEILGTSITVGEDYYGLALCRYTGPHTGHGDYYLLLTKETTPGKIDEISAFKPRINYADEMVGKARNFIRSQKQGQTHLSISQLKSILEDKIGLSSSPVTSGGIDASLRSASMPDNGMGGIDFRVLPMTIRPMGSFSGLNFNLPRLSRAELARFNIDSEMEQIQRMASSGIVPSGERIKELVAACVQKGQISQRADNLLLCLIDICKLQEESACGSSPEFREALVIVDSQA